MTTPTQQETVEGLSPCPFCGDQEPELNWRTQNSLFYVECTGCLAQVFDKEASRAIAAWNRRATSLSHKQGEPVWHKLSQRLPTDRQIVLVKAEAWTHPRVLEYTEFPFPRLLDRQQGWHCWYPERMHWMPLPAALSAAPSQEGGEG